MAASLRKLVNSVGSIRFDHCLNETISVSPSLGTISHAFDPSHCLFEVQRQVLVRSRLASQARRIRSLCSLDCGEHVVVQLEQLARAGACNVPFSGQMRSHSRIRSILYPFSFVFIFLSHSLSSCLSMSILLSKRRKTTSCSGMKTSTDDRLSIRKLTERHYCPSLFISLRRACRLTSHQSPVRSVITLKPTWTGCRVLSGDANNNALP